MNTNWIFGESREILNSLRCNNITPIISKEFLKSLQNFKVLKSLKFYFKEFLPRVMHSEMSADEIIMMHEICLK